MTKSNPFDPKTHGFGDRLAGGAALHVSSMLSAGPWTLDGALGEDGSPKNRMLQKRCFYFSSFSTLGSTLVDSEEERER